MEKDNNFLVQLAAGISVAAVAVFVGQTVATTGIATWLGKFFLGHGESIIKDKLEHGLGSLGKGKSTTVLNHDVQKAMLRSIQNAFNEIYGLYAAEVKQGKPWLHNLSDKDDKDCQTARAFLDELYGQVKADFSQNPDRSFTTPEVKNYLYNDSQTTSLQLFEGLHLNFEGMTERCGALFTNLFRENILSKVRGYFIEELKTNERVRVGFEQFLMQQIQTDVEGMKQQQQTLHQDEIEKLDELEAWLADEIGRHSQTLAQLTQTADALLVASTETIGKLTEVEKDVKILIEQTELKLTDSEEYQRFLQREAELNQRFAKNQAQLKRLEEIGEQEMADDKRTDLLKIESEREQLRKEKEAFMAFAKEIAQRALNLPDNQTTQAIRALIAQGKYQAANALLQPDKLKEMSAALKEKNRELANWYLLKAGLTTNPGTQNENPNWFEEADGYYREAIDLHTDLDTLGAYTQFLQTHRRYEAAIACAQQCLALPLTDEKRIEILANLIFLYDKRGNYAAILETMKAFGAVGNNIRLTNANPDMVELTNAVNSFLASKEKGGFDYQAFLPITQKIAEAGLALLAKENPSEAEQVAAANMLIGASQIRKVQQDYDAALDFATKALSIRRQLAHTHPKAYLQDVGDTLNELGVLQDIQGDPVAALESLTESLAIRRNLAVGNPQTYEPFVAETLHNIGVVHGYQDNASAALEALTQALVMRRNLAAVDPTTYLPIVGVTLCALGELYAAQSDCAKAVQCYEETMRIYEPLAASSIPTYQLSFSCRLPKFGRCLC